ncbi:MAG: arsenite methyltransferase [Candidatus Riflebacteria bacterium]|nr:arsenite methyltransferase [Candidatus Riflebacteria bacterium]
MEFKVLKDDEIRQKVSQRYAKVAGGCGSSCGSASGCCSDPMVNPEASEKLGYGKNELTAVPEGANMGLGCGNPQVLAQLRPGETVLDLGSGGGFDCFLAARKVGASGLVIGVDMTPDMISKARKNAVTGGFENVEFRLGEIEHLPVADNNVDVIISNCVINLSPDKKAVFAEAYRVLRKNGRIAVSDVVALQPMPEQMLQNNDAYCGCVAGAVSVEELDRIIEEQGFNEVKIELKPNSAEFIRGWFPGAEKHVCSASITAVKL